MCYLALMPQIRLFQAPPRVSEPLSAFSLLYYVLGGYVSGFDM